MATRNWISFWDSETSIYVNAHHRTVHYRRIADELARYVKPGAMVLDYGCGETQAAGRIAEIADQLILSDAAPNVRTALSARYSGNGKIAVMAPDDVATMLDRSLDVIVLHSVAQYMKPEELDALFKLFRRLLKPDGLLVVGDIIPPDSSALTDVVALLRFAAREHFLIAALAGIVRTIFSDYRKLRAELGLTRYRENEMLTKLKAADFVAERAENNIGHNSARMTFLARPES
jgi:SAM-dependent methyltransferase